MDILIPEFSHIVFMVSVLDDGEVQSGVEGGGIRGLHRISLLPHHHHYLFIIIKI